MELTIVKDDRLVGVDGVFVEVSFDDVLGLPEGLHAVQWDGNKGHIELATRNEGLSSLDATWLQALIARHAEAVEEANKPVAVAAETQRAALKALIQRTKSRRLDSGFSVDGILFDSDEKARIAYLELAQRLAMDPSYVCRDWKASSGNWVVMDAQMFTKVYAAGTKLMEKCFAWQKAQEERLASAADEDLAAFELT